jgi:hypothetical protein
MASCVVCGELCTSKYCDKCRSIVWSISRVRRDDGKLSATQIIEYVRENIVLEKNSLRRCAKCWQILDIRKFKETCVCRHCRNPIIKSRDKIPMEKRISDWENANPRRVKELAKCRMYANTHKEKIRESNKIRYAILADKTGPRVRHGKPVLQEPVITWKLGEPPTDENYEHT